MTLSLHHIMPLSCISHPLTTEGPKTPKTILRPPTPQLLILKSQTNTIHTMSLIRRRRISLPLEHVPQMSPTITTHNFRPLHPKGTIRMPRHGTRNAVKVRRPPASGFELVRCAVQGRGAGGAAVGAGSGRVFVVGAGEGCFGSAGTEDTELFWIR